MSRCEVPRAANQLSPGVRGEIEDPDGTCCDLDRNRGPSAPLSRKTDLAHQFGVTRISSQEIKLKVGRKVDQGGVVFLICGVEPLEGMLLFAQVTIELPDYVRRNETHLGFALRE